MNFNGKVIDAHIHFTDMYDENGKNMFDGLNEYQKKYGFKNINICCIPFSFSDISNNILAAIYKLKNPTAYAYGGPLYVDFPVVKPAPEGLDMLTQYNELMEIGFDGIKFYDSKPKEAKMLKVFPDDDFNEAMFAQAEKDGTHFIWHVGDPDTFWDAEKAPEWTHRLGYFYGDGTYPSNEAIYTAVLNVLKRHPKLNITFAHFFFWSEYPERLVNLFETYPNVSIDLVPGSELYGGILKNYDFYKDFFKKYSSRILYGTDVTFPRTDDYSDVLTSEVYNSVATSNRIEIYNVEGKGLNLPEDVCRNILYNNFIRCNKSDTPRPINKAALKKYIEKYIGYATKEKEKEFILEFAKTL